MAEVVSIKKFIGFEKGKAPKETFDFHADGLVPYLSPEYLRGTGNPLYVKPSNKLASIDEGELIILWDGSNAGEVFVSKKGILGSTMTKIIFDENEFDKSYFGYALKYNEYFLKAKTAGSGIPHVDKGIVKKIEVFKPEKSEQRIIASILSKVDETIAATKKSIAKAERLKKALMQNLLTGKLKPNGTWRKKDEFYKDEKFGNVPKGWKYDRLETVLSNCQYGINATSVEDGKFPMLRMNNIIGGKMVNQPMVYIDLDKKLFEKYKVNSGDILFNRTNSMDLVGKLGIFKLEGNYVFASYLIRLTVNQNNIPEYFNYYLNSYEGQCKLRSKATPSVSQANINAGNVKRLIVPIPPKDEQLLISNKIESIETLLTSKQIKIKKLERLKKALMQNLLTGKVRVKVPKEQLLTETW